MPENAAERFKTLLAALREFGTQGAVKWSSFSKLTGNRYHCHLTYHYVACWTQENETLTIEVIYAGSRENAPY